ncbi:hypothetical protein IQ266_23360 [filamentous cyanobacterium LEGE 11480]|uniref:Uncharacterized protein n=2 Tax=Romeriopsis TaxID=2992131 RepID=A0A928VV87_9CYAN|nr:hypothetical protein [Romeriopsis navalis LEGE 11480]
MANLLGIIWILFGAYFGLVSIRHRSGQVRRFTINLMITMLYIVFGLIAALFGQHMAADQQWIFLAFTFSTMYVTWELLKISRVG